jgi:hypothetical protein
MFNLPDIWSPL